MKSKAFVQITAMSLLALMAGVATAWASDGEEADLRPVWMSDQSLYTQGSALLYSEQNPSFLPSTLGQEMQASHSVQNVEQQYLARSRDYDMRQTYGIATTTDEGSYVSDVSGMGKSMFTAARLAPIQQYQKNFNQSEQQGDISEPVQVVGGAVAVGSGAQVPFKIGDQAKGTWSGDLMNQSGQLDLKSPVVDARFEMNMRNLSLDPTQPLDPTNANERYRVTVNREIAFKVSSSVVYGSSSNSFLATVNRPIIDHLLGSVGTTRPAGDNISGLPPEVRGGISYGISF